ncbi:hypothetical protein Y717_22530 [Streptomyces scopuliridis RB72]|uniref:Uncharacterized protein n=1 Tax=Streptomyces scopuliridis RB72 TaxID=1440053 RepID=A0A2T7T468_9ACTN|nr:hypothetical protein Y717_22530 [Streptomyces scopuliridis RB72]
MYEAHRDPLEPDQNWFELSALGDQVPSAQSVDDAGDTAGSQAHRRSELSHPQAVLGCFAEPEEDGEVRHRQARGPVHPAQLRGAVKDAADGLGRLDILVNSAAVMVPGTIDPAIYRSACCLAPRVDRLRVDRPRVGAP